ncbi:MAG TPA: hypothetical protein VMF89_12240, partial [Polyangiales bacterium]|nr:hypothetical protein [Polyangiales bacterium]
ERCQSRALKRAHRLFIASCVAAPLARVAAESGARSAAQAERCRSGALSAAGRETWFGHARA